AYQAAKERGAQLVAVTGGGKLAEQAESDGAPLVRIPSGLPPRAAIGYAFFTLYGVLKRLGAVESGGAGRVDVDETIELLRAMAGRLGRETPTEENAAKQLALQLYGKLPWVYGSVGWKG